MGRFSEVDTVKTGDQEVETTRITEVDAATIITTTIRTRMLMVDNIRLTNTISNKRTLV